jgi:hypothetical protein
MPLTQIKVTAENVKRKIYTFKISTINILMTGKTMAGIKRYRKKNNSSLNI